MSDSPVLDSPEAIDAHLAAAIERWERGRRGVRFVLCDEEDRVQVHCPVDDLPARLDPDDCAQAVGIFANALAERAGDGSMLVVLTRSGSSAVSDPDRLWFHTAYQVCGQAGVRLLGVHLVTPTDQRRILLDDAL
ncbi:hypothetical protein EDC02_3718 [Micromonospora sp. Llam0]|uniref:hypothetical protein n=1 Tax=Micromonosporaceae TaxID=28056 RepID=UPI000FABBDFD|nr:MULTISPECIES: hypothetical protein [Micromonosporaceae]ROO61766.1 hypothetical protein EDC02_3718 [Micromonospora sp. Llam0]WBB95428.1 hypothetical protein O7553_18785 [Solwaraspora sp. WMMA2059]WBC20667.1 hypothetical protein O7543_28580 [Solwaraspora sp. WMMA2080]WJK37202.1 hypothetical protein O7610_13105 [Solwaraspora sp. WMMA2065]